jgi:hypothetical protein
VRSVGAAFIVFCSICRYAVAPVLLIADLPPIDVQRELAAMRAELAEMRVEQRDQWLDEEGSCDE